MGIVSFIKDAGEKLFGRSAAQAEEKTTGAGPTPAAASDAAARAIEDYIRAMKLDADDLQITFDASSSTVTVAGTARDQETREKIALCCGNVAGVEKVVDRMTVSQPSPEAKWYTVVRGDTLSKIAKEQYGNASAYMTIFDANRPMLTHPDKIYPGQVLRIPPQG